MHHPDVANRPRSAASRPLAIALVSLLAWSWACPVAIAQAATERAGTAQAATTQAATPAMQAAAQGLELPAGAPATASPLVTDMPTVLAIGATTYTLTNLWHESAHEIGYALAGSRPTGVSLALALGDESRLTASGRQVVAASGAAANFLAGAGSATWLYVAPPQDGATYYATWLFTATNLFSGSGYLMVGPWISASDFGTDNFLKPYPDALPYQIGLSALGTGLTFGSLFLVDDLAKPLLGRSEPWRSERMWSLTIPAYLLGSGLVTGSSLLNRAGPEFGAVAAVATFAGTLFIAYIPLFFHSDVFHPGLDKAPEKPLDIDRSWPWISTGIVAGVLAIGALGPGVGDFPHATSPLLTMSW